MNKQIIVRGIISFVFIGFSLWILVPIFLKFIKMKMSSQSGYGDIDWMIKNQKNKLKLQYGGVSASNPASESAPLRPVELSKDISKQVNQHYSYTLSENKIQNFLQLAEKRKIMNFLSAKHQNVSSNKINFLFQALILYVLTDEIVKKSFTMSQVLAKKLSLTLFEFSMGVQIKMLLHMKASARTEAQVFSDHYNLHNFTDENVNLALDSIMHKEADLWAQSPSLLFEELSLYFHYASIVQPLPEIRSKTDIKSASIILGCLETDSLEIIKKKYKKLALLKHPDKIMAQKLPPKLEKKGVENFNKIQEAFEILSQAKK